MINKVIKLHFQCFSYMYNYSPTTGLSFRSLVNFCIVLLVVNSDKAGEIGTRLGGGG